MTMHIRITIFWDVETRINR